MTKIKYAIAYTFNLIRLKIKNIKLKKKLFKAIFHCYPGTGYTKTIFNNMYIYIYL